MKKGKTFKLQARGKRQKVTSDNLQGIDKRLYIIGYRL